MASAELSRRVEKVVGYLRANMIAPNPTAIVKAHRRLARLTMVRTSPALASCSSDSSWATIFTPFTGVETALTTGRSGSAAPQASQPSCARRSRRGPVVAVW